MTLLELPEEIVVEILSLLPVTGLTSCSLVSHSFHRLAKDTSLWKAIFVETKITEQTPSPRLWTATVSLKGKMYLYGGHTTQGVSNVITNVKKDLFEYDFGSKTWTPQQHSMTGMTEHKCVANNDALWFVGGYNGHEYCNSLYKYDLETKQSSLIDTTGQTFSPRSALTAVVWKNKMYTFGGWNGFNRIWFNDMHEYNFDTSTWRPVEPKGTIPHERTSHSAVVYNNCMYVFAGYSGEKYLNDLHEFNFETETWTDLSQNCGGKPPAPRSRFCAAVHEDTMYIIGGWNKVGYYADIFTFNFQSRIWTQILNKSFEAPRISQCSVVIQDDILYIFGGFCANEKVCVNRLYRYRLPAKEEEVHEPPHKKGKSVN